jgi:hypothetical protein
VRCRVLATINIPSSSLTGCYHRPQMPSSMFFQHNTALVPVGTVFWSSW